VSETAADRPSGRLAFQAMDQRLEKGGERRPLVIAFSGGGDSLFLLLAARAWARRAGRRLIGVTIDHGLQAASADWAQWCAARADRLGVEHHILTWEGPKPSAGLPAAARLARHGLLAARARQAGALVVLMGHTNDDRRETRLMRAQGSSTPQPRDWAPSPVWPQGRDVFILRPLLACSRAALRDELSAAGEAWLDDPLNADVRFARARARAALGAQTASAETDGDGSNCEIAAVAGEVSTDEAGVHRLARKAMSRLDPPIASALLGRALVTASGAARPPRPDRLARLLVRLAGEETFTATLAGSRVEAGAGQVRIMREPGEWVRAGAAAEMSLAQGCATAWDGRFEIEARFAGLKVRPVAGAAGRLSKAERGRLRSFPPAARRALPAIVDPSGALTCPILAGDGRLAIRPLVGARLAAACGAVRDEAAARRMAPAPPAS
jgi:tRNA(Ile)-lysidine synthase